MEVEAKTNRAGVTPHTRGSGVSHPRGLAGYDDHFYFFFLDLIFFFHMYLVLFKTPGCPSMEYRHQTSSQVDDMM